MKLIISTIALLLLTSCTTACKISLADYCFTIGASIEITQEEVSNESTTA